MAPSEEQPEVQAEMGVPGQVTELPYDADKATVEPEVKSKARRRKAVGNERHYIHTHNHTHTYIYIYTAT